MKESTPSLNNHQFLTTELEEFLPKDDRLNYSSIYCVKIRKLVGKICFS